MIICLSVIVLTWPLSSHCKYTAEDNRMSDTDDSTDEEFDNEYFIDDEELDEELEEIDVTGKIPPASIADLIKDPWPKSILFVTIVGFIIVLFTPSDTWSIWNWTLVAMYGLITVCTMVAPYSLRIWYEGEGWVRYVGIGNFFIMIGTTFVGTIDTLLWLSLGSGLIPGFEVGSILLGCFVVVVFLSYSLYFAFRFITGEAQT